MYSDLPCMFSFLPNVVEAMNCFRLCCQRNPDYVLSYATFLFFSPRALSNSVQAAPYVHHFSILWFPARSYLPTLTAFFLDELDIALGANSSRSIYSCILECVLNMAFSVLQWEDPILGSRSDGETDIASFLIPVVVFFGGVGAYEWRPMFGNSVLHNKIEFLHREMGDAPERGTSKYK